MTNRLIARWDSLSPEAQERAKYAALLTWGAALAVLSIKIAHRYGGQR